MATGGGVTSAPKTDGDIISVATYNIRYADANEEGIDAWDHRKEHLLKYIQITHPTILSLQEARHRQVKYLYEHLSKDGFEKIGVGRNDGKHSSDFNPIFYDSKIVQKQKEGVFWLSETPETVGSKHPESKCVRICQYIKIANINTNYHLWIFNTHLDHMSEVARQFQTEKLLEKINNIVGDDKEQKNCAPVLLMGDFNCTAKDTPYNKIIQNGFTDTAKEVTGNKENMTSTFCGFKNQHDKTIDFIFRRGPVDILQFDVDKSTVRPNGRRIRNISDHRPIIIHIAV